MFMRQIIFFNNFYYPLASIQWVMYTVVVLYMLYSTDLVFHLNVDMVQAAYMPYILMCGIINRVATRPVASMDAISASQLPNLPTCINLSV